MNKQIVFIDDEINENSPYGKDLKNLIEECQLTLMFLNERNKIEKFMKEPENTGLVLLDRDLSKIKMDPVGILRALSKKNIPVIILSRYKATDEHFKDDFRKLDKRLDYILKEDIDNPDRRLFIKNLISRAIHDKENKELIAVVDCNVGKIKILWKKSRELITDEIDLRIDNPDWAVRSKVPVYPQEAILRILYEMGKRGTTEVNISSIYLPVPAGILDKKDRDILIQTLNEIRNKQFISETTKSKIDEIEKIKNNIPMRKVKKIILDLKDILNKNPYNIVVRNAIETLSDLGDKSIRLPQKFGDTLSSFNEAVREKTCGLLVGSLLKGTRGRGKGLYKANIGKIMLEGTISESIPLSWKENIENRLKQIESDLKVIKGKLNIVNRPE